MKKKLVLVIVPLILLMAMMPLLASAAGGPWSDNFDSYGTGMQLHGVGGWKGWDNNATFGAMTSSAQARSAPNSVDINGLSDLVHEYTTNSGDWIYTAWMYIPGNMQGQTYFIMLNDYNDGGPYNWSTVVSFNSATGMMLDEGASGLSQPYIADQWVELRVEIDLDNDTQDFYYNGALFYSGTWTGHVSGGGALIIEAVDLYANNATSVYYDDLSLLSAAGPPALEVSKSPDTQDVITGGNADFTITITNTGGITFTNVAASDPLVPACDNNFTDLGPGAVQSYNCTDVGVTTNYTNTVIVTGTPGTLPPVVVSDTAVVNVNAPTSVSLTGLAGDSAGMPMVWVIGTISASIAAGILVLLRRRRWQS